MLLSGVVVVVGSCLSGGRRLMALVPVVAIVDAVVHARKAHLVSFRSR